MAAVRMAIDMGETATLARCAHLRAVNSPTKRTAIRGRLTRTPGAFGQDDLDLSGVMMSLGKMTLILYRFEVALTDYFPPFRFHPLPLVFALRTAPSTS